MINSFLMKKNKTTNDGRGRVFWHLWNCCTVCPSSRCLLSQSPSFGNGIDGKLSLIATVTARRMSSFNWKICKREKSLPSHSKNNSVLTLFVPPRASTRCLAVGTKNIFFFPLVAIPIALIWKRKCFVKLSFPFFLITILLRNDFTFGERMSNSKINDTWLS